MPPVRKLHFCDRSSLREHLEIRADVREVGQRREYDERIHQGRTVLSAAYVGKRRYRLRFHADIPARVVGTAIRCLGCRALKRVAVHRTTACRSLFCRSRGSQMEENRGAGVFRVAANHVAGHAASGRLSWGAIGMTRNRIGDTGSGEERAWEQLIGTAQVHKARR